MNCFGVDVEVERLPPESGESWTFHADQSARFSLSEA